MVALIFTIAFLFENTENTKLISQTVTNPPTIAIKEKLYERGQVFYSNFLETIGLNSDEITPKWNIGELQAAKVLSCIDGDTI